jgi:hypothetical protein
MDAPHAERSALSAGEAEVFGEPVDVVFSGHLRKVFAAKGQWWAKVALVGEGADITASLDVPLICVRLWPKLYGAVQVPGASPSGV